MSAKQTILCNPFPFIRLLASFKILPPHSSRILKIPFFTISNGKLLVERNGTYEELLYDNEVVDCCELSEFLHQKFENIYVIDLDGIIKNTPQIHLLKKIFSFGNTWIDCGLRYADDGIDIFTAGASYVVLSTKTIMDINELDYALELSDNIIFCIDYKESIVAYDKKIRSLKPQELARNVKEKGIEKIILFFYNKIEKSIIEDVAKAGCELYIYGRAEEVKRFENMVNGIIVSAEEFM